MIDSSNFNTQDPSKSNSDNSLINSENKTADAKETSNQIYPGFWIRFEAFLIDTIILSILLTLTFRYIFPYLDDYLGIKNPFWISGSVFFLIAWLYYALFEFSALKATPGKIIKGLSVVDKAGDRISFFRATLRYLGRLVSAIVFFIGFLRIAFVKKKQGWHDIISRTQIVFNKQPQKKSGSSFILIPVRVLKFSFLIILSKYLFLLCVLHAFLFSIETLWVKPIIRMAIDSGKESGIFDIDYRFEKDLRKIIQFPPETPSRDITPMFMNFLGKIEDPNNKKGNDLEHDPVTKYFRPMSLDETVAYSGSFKTFDEGFNKIRWDDVKKIHLATEYAAFMNIIIKTPPKEFNFNTMNMPSYLGAIFLSKAIILKARESYLKGNNNEAQELMEESVHLGRIVSSGLSAVDYYIGYAILKTSLQAWLNILPESSDKHALIKNFLKKYGELKKLKGYWTTSLYSPFLQLRLKNLFKKYKKLLDPEKIPDAFWGEAIFNYQLLCRLALHDIPICDSSRQLDEFLPANISPRLKELVKTLDFEPSISKECFDEAKKIKIKNPNLLQSCLTPSKNIQSLKFHEKMLGYLYLKPILMSVDGILAAVRITPLRSSNSGKKK